MHTAVPQLFVSPVLQLPCPSQVLGARSVLPWQLRGAHSTPMVYLRQAPWPLQVPSRPQVVSGSAAHSLSGSRLSGTGRQRPSLPARLQARQAPLQADSQQKPSTHWPVRQPAFTAQRTPLAPPPREGEGPGTRGPSDADPVDPSPTTSMARSAASGGPQPTEARVPASVQANVRIGGKTGKRTARGPTS